MYSVVKRTFAIFTAIKLIATILMLICPSLFQVCSPFCIFSPFFVMAIAYTDIPKYLLLLLLLWSLVSVVIFVISLIVLMISRFCKKMRVDFWKYALGIFYLWEAVSCFVSFIAGLASLGWRYSIGKLVGFVFNCTFVVMLVYLSRHKKNKPANNGTGAGNNSRSLKK